MREIRCPGNWHEEFKEISIKYTGKRIVDCRYFYKEGGMCLSIIIA